MKMAPNGLPILDAPSVSGAVVPALKDVLNRADAPAELSTQAKDHFARVNSIAGDALRDLEAVSEEVGKLRDEITLRARMLGEATIEFDELARAASQGYSSIRKALDMVRQKFAAAMAPRPSLPTQEHTKAPPTDAP